MLQIALLGFGVVGSGTAEVITENQDRIRLATGGGIEIRYSLSAGESLAFTGAIRAKEPTLAFDYDQKRAQCVCFWERMKSKIRYLPDTEDERYLGIYRHMVMQCTQMMARYEGISFYREDGSMYLLGCPHVNTEVLVRHGLEKNGQEQTVGGFHVYPANWFNPLDSATGEVTKTENTVSIHWYSMSWISPARRLRVKIMRFVRRLIRHLSNKER